MTVKELIEELKKFPSEAIIRLEGNPEHIFNNAEDVFLGDEKTYYVYISCIKDSPEGQ